MAPSFCPTLAPDVSSVRALVFVACALLGCGRQATAEDCAFILEKNVEVQMRSMNLEDPAAIEKKKREIRTEFEEDLKGCVGKRVSEGTMNCVRGAQKPDDIDRCLR